MNNRELELVGANNEERLVDSNTSNNTNNSNDEDVTSVTTEINVQLPPSNSNRNNLDFQYISPGTNNRLWTNEERDAYEERRRETLNQELNRVQRTNFIHFSTLCSIPILLIGLVLFYSFRDDGDCIGYDVLNCRREPRHFMNAFGNECICEAFNFTSVEE